MADICVGDTFFSFKDLERTIANYQKEQFVGTAL